MTYYVFENEGLIGFTQKKPADIDSFEVTEERRNEVLEAVNNRNALAMIEAGEIIVIERGAVRVESN